VVLGCVIAIAITCYVYRHIILVTLEAFAAAVGILALIGATFVIAVNARRYQKRRTAAAIRSALAVDTEPMPQLVTEPPAAMPDSAAAMAAAAEWLENEGTELAFTKDGKLVAKGDGAP
jgi:hypothetical protein